MGADAAGPSDGVTRRSDWLGNFFTILAGETAHRARIPGGIIAIYPEPEPILAIVRTVALGLTFVFVLSGTVLWLYVRGVRRAALRPLPQASRSSRHPFP